ncbi:MAG: MotA/TolQ/ExbB proton channel family protein [Prevotellaceae bacterium]|jgi:biopolymer transport protein ExbB|nr:MotA/TolQ/ExbB proton channel family protein [Prevotellaceae bacterium]
MKSVKHPLLLMTLLILPVIGGFAQNAAAELPAEATQPASLSLWDLTMKGGWLMIPLFILSILAVYIFIERWWLIQQSTRSSTQRFMNAIKEYIRESRIEAAIALCERENTPTARMIEKGISHLGRPLADIREAIENIGNLEIARLERGLPILATVAGGAPMIGFLGTVVGMVEAFYNMAQAGDNISMSVLSGGIYVALVTTVAGLIVGIIAYFGYNYLTTRIKNFVNKLEKDAILFTDILNEPVK